MKQLIREAKLYPNKRQEEKLLTLFEDCRKLYNTILETKIKVYQENKKTIHRFELHKMFKNYKADIPASLKQSIASRVNTAYDRFFRKLGKFPRFKSKNRFRSIDLRQYKVDYRIKDNYLSVWRDIGYLRMIGMQKLNNPKGARIIKRASGWYVQVIDEVIETPKENKKEVGIDLGLKYFLADVMEAIKNEAHIHDNDMSDIYFKWKEEFGNSEHIITDNTLTKEQKEEFSNAPFVSNVVKKIEELTGKKVMKIEFTNDWKDADRIYSVEFDYQ